MVKKKKKIVFKENIKKEMFVDFLLTKIQI